MKQRIEEAVGFFIFLLAALLGFWGIVWWAIAEPILLVAAKRYRHHVKFARQHPVHGTDRVLVMAIAATLLNSSLFVTLAFVMGRTIAWLVV